MKLGKLLKIASVTLGLGLAVSGAQATIINLGSAGVAGNGPTFCGAGNAQSVTVSAGGYDVVLSGGVALGPNITFLPATTSVAYGTADFANSCTGQSGYTNPLTIQFFLAGTNTPTNVTNFFVDLFNGNTVPVNYTIADNLGNTSSFLIGDNISSGQYTFGFAAAGNTITITGGAAPGGCCAWDFFVDNIGFNEPVPGTVPEPETLWLAGLGVLGVWAVRRRRKA